MLNEVWGKKKKTTLGVFGESVVNTENVVCFPFCQELFSAVGFLTLESKNTVQFSDMLPVPTPDALTVGAF